MEALFRQEVTSDCHQLQDLHEQFAWIPGEVSIRPSDAVKAVKLETLLEVEEQWVSFSDYLLCTVFGKPKAKNGTGKFYSADREASELDMVFQANDYPYDNIQSNHWILWYGSQYRPYDSSKISKDIEDKLNRHLNDDERFDFVWYENPKMSLPEFYHVHVFWIQWD